MLPYRNQTFVGQSQHGRRAGAASFVLEDSRDAKLVYHVSNVRIRYFFVTEQGTPKLTWGLKQGNYDWDVWNSRASRGRLISIFHERKLPIKAYCAIELLDFASRNTPFLYFVI